LGDTVLLKNQTTTTQNGIYTVTVAGATGIKCVLTRRIDIPAIVGGAHVPVTNGTANAGKAFYVSTPSAVGAAITYDTTSISFTQSSKWVLTRRTDSPAIVGGAHVPVSNGTANAGKAFYVSTPSTVGAAITYDSTSLAFSASQKWVLTRRSDSPALAAGSMVTATTGSTNSGKTFSVTTPASGPITYDSTNISFSQAAKWVLTRRSDSPALAGGSQVPVTAGSTNIGKTFFVSTPSTIGAAITYDSTSISFTQSTFWVLTRRTDTPALAPNFEVSITAGSTNTGKTYYVSTPSSGSITYDTTSIGFTPSSKFVLTRRSDTPALAGGYQVPVTSGSTNNGKTFYVTTPASGAITYDSTAIAFGQSSQWSLVRRSPDNDDQGDIVVGQQVSITSGSTNGGKTFYVSTPASGTITLNVMGIAYAQSTAWKLTRSTLADSAPTEVFPGLQVSVSAGSTNSGKTFFISDPTTAITLNTTPISFTQVSSWVLTRTTDADTDGDLKPGTEVAVANGSTNGDKVFYVSTPSSGNITINTTGMAFTESGMPSMMVPALSPDGKKVVYVNGDSDLAGAPGVTGWRRGLTVFDFNWSAATSTFTVGNKKRLINNYDSATAGTIVKWPFFENDSHSVLYVESSTDEFCSSSDTSTSPTTDQLRACYQGSFASSIGARGNMTPTARGYKPGKIYSIDATATTPSTTRVELAKLNDADDDGGTDDSLYADHSYQPTVLPFSSGGFRWVIFTSPRAYGNQINPKSYASTTYGTATNFTCAAPNLWVSALKDSAADGTDRSNPAFFLPGQKVAKPTASNDYINERGYLVRSPCKDDGDSCSTDDECCGYDSNPVSAACRAPAGWTPASGPPAKTCEALGGTCHNATESCTVASDCCNGASCINFACAEPGNFDNATFTREYVAECPTGYHPDWQLLQYHLTTDGDSYLQFQAQTSQDLGTLDAAAMVDLGTSTSTVVSPADPEAIDVGAKLTAAGLSRHLANLRVIVNFFASTDKKYAPILRDWEMRYTCAPAE
jgi:uncharacterized lipoprotein